MKNNIIYLHNNTCSSIKLNQATNVLDLKKYKGHTIEDVLIEENGDDLIIFLRNAETGEKYILCISGGLDMIHFGKVQSCLSGGGIIERYFR